MWMQAKHTIVILFVSCYLWIATCRDAHWTLLCRFVVNRVHAPPAARAVTLISQRKILHDFVRLMDEMNSMIFLVQKDLLDIDIVNINIKWRACLKCCIFEKVWSAIAQSDIIFFLNYWYIPYRQWVYICRQYTLILTYLIMVGKTPTGFKKKNYSICHEMRNHCGLLFID